jgi:RNA polymerase sigma-70 factor (ECF subfamily)
MGDAIAALQALSLDHVPDAGARIEVDRTRALLDANFVFIWRLLKRLGVSDNDVDDAVQRVFIVASRRIDEIAEGSQRSFLFGTALRVASSYRRAARKREMVNADVLASCADDGPSADETIARREGVAILDRIIGAMPDELRIVFILCEIEELTVPEAAALQQIPVGTAASRLRRARKQFEDEAKRVWKQRRPEGGSRG